MLTQNEAMGAATASDGGTCAHSLILGKNYDVMHKYITAVLLLAVNSPTCRQLAVNSFSRRQLIKFT